MSRADTFRSIVARVGFDDLGKIRFFTGRLEGYRSRERGSAYPH